MHDAIQSRPIWMSEPIYGARYGWLHKPAIHLLLSCDVLFASRLYRVIEPTLLQPLCLGICAALILFYTGFSWLRLYLVPVALVVIGFSLLVNQMLIFSNFTHIPVETNSLFQYIWIFTFILFFCAGRDGHGNYIVNSAIYYSTAYVVVYVILATFHKIGIVPSSAISGLVLSDPERGDRLYAHVLAINLAWFAWLYRARVQMNFKSILVLLLCILSFYFLMSRVATLIVIILSMLYLCRLSVRSIGLLSFIIFILLTIPNLYGLYDPLWNPFALFAGDSSGNFRTLEYRLARSFIWENPVFGFGIAPTPKAASFLLDNDFFSGSDLGPIGVWFDYGLGGLILFVLAVGTICRPAFGIRPSLAVPLSLTGCFMGAYGCLAPVIFAGGATFFAIILGLKLGNQVPRGRQSLPWHRPERP